MTAGQLIRRLRQRGYAFVACEALAGWVVAEKASLRNYLADAFEPDAVIAVFEDGDNNIFIGHADDVTALS